MNDIYICESKHTLVIIETECVSDIYHFLFFAIIYIILISMFQKSNKNWIANPKWSAYFNLYIFMAKWVSKAMKNVNKPIPK